MLKTTLCGTFIKQADEETDYDLKLEYYMLSEPLCSEYSDLLRYGVKIKMETFLKEGKKEEETKEIRDIFYRQKDAEEFIRLLIENRVTPTHFKDVVEEYIKIKVGKKVCAD